MEKNGHRSHPSVISMEILIIGNISQREEVELKFGAEHHYSAFTSHEHAQALIKSSQVVFDFLIADNPGSIAIYKPYHSLVVFIDVTLITLSGLNLSGYSSVIFGFCGMPTFLNREVLEVSIPKEDQHNRLKKICKELNTSYQIVADKVGLVTPRVICMIINEAYYTVEEGTATQDDIDKAMKLGTNYPYGPFEWCERIGKENVKNLLNAVYNDTADSRYKLCSLLTR